MPPGLRSPCGPALAFAIRESRKVLLWGAQPEWAALGLYGLASAALLWLGLKWFQRLRGRLASAL